MSQPTACWGRVLVDRHFEATITPEQERSLRSHLEECAACQTRYERRMLLAALDPQAPDAATRVGVGLGLLPRQGPTRHAWVAAAAVCAAAALALVVLMPGVLRRDREAGSPHVQDPLPAPVPRGRAPDGASAPDATGAGSLGGGRERLSGPARR